MANSENISCIDVGTTKVCSIMANVGQGGDLQVLGVGVTHTKGLHKGLVVNITEAKESIRASVRRAEQASGLKMDSVYVGVTGRHITSLNKKGVVSISRGDRLVRPEDLKRVLRSARTYTIPNDRRLLHVIPRSYALDGQVGVKNPVGMHGFRLDVETHVITAAVSSVQNLVKCIRGVSIEIEDLVLEPLASAEAVLRLDERDAGVILADIGGGTTDIAIFKNGSIWHTAILPVAGYQITRDIAIGLGLPFDVAEQMKRKYGSVMPLYNGVDDEATTMSMENGYGVSYQDLNDIVRARVEEIMKLIALELPPEYVKEVPAGLVITGGCANLRGIETLGQEVLELPVRVGVPTGVYGIADILPDPAYATGVGLLLWGQRRHEGEEGWQARGLSDTFRRFVTRMRRIVIH
ncbi:MAG: cell division protein FtsA [Dehalococcoidia bacterium]|nr:MAG: cell division protein FtsA [Dehalococcoidia bacterium]